MLGPFSINMLVFTFLFLMTQMVDITNWVVNYDLDPLDVLAIIFFTLPWFLMFIIPMSTMMAILLTFLRLSSDNEITALKSGGISFYRLLPPVFLFSLFGFFLTSFMTLVGVPWGNVSLEKLALKVLSSNVDIGLKERTFNDSFENVMLYVNKIDIKDKKIIDIFIEDKRQAEMVSTVVAPEGRLISDPDKSAIHLQLFNGTIHQTNLKNRSVNSISFDTYLLNFELDRKVVKFEDKKKDADEMGLAELREYIKKSKTRDKDYWKAQIVFHRKFAYPIACFALALSAMPLGIQSGSVKRSFGLALGLFFFFLYYLLLSIAIILGESGKLHPAVGMYLPIVITGFIGLYLFNNTAKERTIPLVLLFQHIRKLTLKFRRI
jgi:lipopolysaccharide export system permease protein